MSRRTSKHSVLLLTTLLLTAFSVGAAYGASGASAKAITSFAISGIAGTIDGTTITVDLTTLPLFTRVDALVATFAATGKTVRVGTKDQVSGKTPNDFSKPVAYTVLAADGSKDTYTVRALFSKATSIAGYADTLIIGSDGSLWGTGRNGDGQLGIGSTSSVSTPKQILPGGVAAVAAGYYHTLILETDGSLWAMGYNKSGQIGNGTDTDVLVPTQILAGGVVAVAGGLVHTVILKTDHSLWATGYNSNGELGSGGSSGVLSFVQIRRPSLAKGDE